MSKARPYIAYELDALQMAPDVARAARLTEDAVIAGNARMWHWCWRAKVDVVTALQVSGFFGGDATGALADFGFLEPIEGGFRVRGAARYLRLSEGRSKGGRAASGNLKRGVKRPEDAPRLAPGSPPAGPRLTPGSLPADSRLTSGSPPGSPPALSSNSEQRTANSEEKKRAEPAATDLPLRDLLELAFFNATAARYAWQPKDDNAVRMLLVLADYDEPEIRRRWDIALRATFRACRSLTDLAKHENWNHHAKAADPPRGAVTALPPAKPQDPNRKPGEIANAF